MTGTTHFELEPAEYARHRTGHLQERRRELISTEIARSCQFGALVVEIGCGPGDVLAALAREHPELSFVGLDVDPAMIEHARSVHACPGLSFVVADLTEPPPVADASLVFGVDVAHHVDLLGLVRRVREVAALDAVWLLVEPNGLNPYIYASQERMKRAGLEEDHFRRAEFELAVRWLGGFRVESRRTAFLVPGRYASVPRWVGRVERLLERVRPLGGSIVYRLRAVP